MFYLDIFIFIFVSYLIVFFVLSRIFIPFMGFRMYRIPTELPDEMRETVKQFEDGSASGIDFLEKVYSFVQNRWHSERAKTITRLPLAFRTDLKQIWNASGYAHCTTINYIFVTMVANSHFFTPADIQIRHRFFNGATHQYVRVRVDGRWLDADPSVKYMRLPFGQRTHRLFG